MIFQPAILALLLASALSAAMVTGGALFGARVLARWDLASGHRRQLAMERRTYLVSTGLGLVLALEALSLLLFVFNADRMAEQFAGAMCAVGTLNANPYGFPALLARIAVFFLAAVWLILDRLDARAPDYPLIRVKYALLIGVAPVVLLAGGLQLAYFLNLRADVIPSCCARLFSPDTAGAAADLSALDPATALGLLYGALAAVVVAGARVLRHRRGGMLYAAVSGLAFTAAIAAVVSALAPYVYEHPTHHCPFCILKSEYNYVGYLFYIPLFFSTALGLGAGPVAALGDRPSLSRLAPRATRSLVRASLAGFGLFGGLATASVHLSGLRLFNG